MKFSILFSCVTLLVLTGCSRSYLVSSGATDNRPLLFENEYELSELKEVEVEGRAFFGIPSFSKNNRNNHTSGMLFYFNGVQLGRTPRILPIASLVTMSFLGGTILSAAFPGDYKYNSRTRDYEYSGGIGIIPGALLSLPITGMVNNLIWSGSAFSGASRTLQHKLVKDNPDVDLFFYPKYDIQRKHVYSGSDITGGNSKIELKYLWVQDAKIKGRCKGAKLKL
jgi:hypothetical protein